MLSHAKHNKTRVCFFQMFQNLFTTNVRPCGIGQLYDHTMACTPIHGGKDKLSKSMTKDFFNILRKALQTRIKLAEFKLIPKVIKQIIFIDSRKIFVARFSWWQLFRESTKNYKSTCVTVVSARYRCKENISWIRYTAKVNGKCGNSGGIWTLELRSAILPLVLSSQLGAVFDFNSLEMNEKFLRRFRAYSSGCPVFHFDFIVPLMVKYHDEAPL